MDFILAHQALIREWINGAAFILFLTISIMVAVFLWDTWISSKPNTRWQTLPGVPTACALWWIFVAEAYRTLNVWFNYQMGKVPSHSDLSTSLGVGIFNANGPFNSMGYLIAGIVLNLGLLRGIYIWTPPDWKRRVWKLALAAALVFISSPILMRIMLDAQ